MIKIAVLGYGTIGSGVVEIIEKNQDVLSKRLGEAIAVGQVLDLRNFEGDPIQEKITHNIETIWNDSEISIVVEAMGGTEPAFSFVKGALERGKSVTTSNKALVAKYGTQLLALAREKGVHFLFEASVGGGIPIIRPLYNALSGEKIIEISGILNGTTNYMLTKMRQENESYEDVLKEAQALGYAERDPSADVDGFDACRKIAILGSLATGHFVDFEDIPTMGIRSITTEDMQLAGALGYEIKLLGTIRQERGVYYASVQPQLVGQDNPLYGVNGVFNGILVEGNMVDKLMFYGSGAGKLPTASAIIADILEIAQNPGKVLLDGWDAEKLSLGDAGLLPKVRFVRIREKGTAQAIALSLLKAEKVVEVDGCGGYALLTAPMTLYQFSEIAKTIQGVAQVLELAI